MCSRFGMGRIFPALPCPGLLNHGLEFAGEDGLQEPEFRVLVFRRDFEIREAFGFLSVVPFAFGVREGNNLARFAVFRDLHFVLLVFVCHVSDVDGWTVTLWCLTCNVFHPFAREPSSFSPWRLLVVLPIFSRTHKINNQPKNAGNV